MTADTPREQSRGAVLGPSLLSGESERRDSHQSVPLASGFEGSGPWAECRYDR